MSARFAARRRKLAALAIAIGLLVSACGGSGTAAFALTPPVEAQELLTEPPAGLVVLDVRTPQEFADGHLADATNIDFYGSSFVPELDGLDKDRPYFVYCRSGNRSAQTVQTMHDLGFTEVYELEGGIVNWLAAGLPTE